jgi:hypothetical protein
VVFYLPVIPRSFLHELIDANYHRGGLKCLELFTLSPEFLFSLRAEILRLAPLGVDSRRHKGAWTNPYGSVRQLSLYNRSGDTDDRSTDYDPNPYGKSFHLAAKCPALARFIGALPTLLNIRLNCLGHHSGLNEHEEEIFLIHKRKTYFRMRFHLPLFTHRNAMVTLDGEAFHFEAGKIYFFHNGCVHGAFNKSSTDRYHLVWDQLLDEKSYEAMFAGALSEKIPLTFDSRVPVGIQNESKGEVPSARASRRWIRHQHLRATWDEGARLWHRYFFGLG